MTIGTGTTLVGLINATIGGVMLVIPIVAMSSGYLDWIVGCLLLACITCYTAYLLVKHLGKAKNIKYLILSHFKGDRTYTTLYNIVIWFSFMGSILVYFKLFCIQVAGILDTKFQFVPQILAFLLVLWVISLRQCDMSEVALAAGITSIIGFVLFISWVIQSAPKGEKFLQPYTPNFSALFLLLINGYTIHDFMIQVITVNPTRKDYPKIIVLLYLISSIIFMYVCFSSSGLINRKPGMKNPETIIDFFENSEDEAWNLTVLQLMYVVHILTTFPEYLIVSKVRIFQIFEIEYDAQDKMTTKEVLYYASMIALAYIIQKCNISLNLILNISGSLLGYLFSMFIPIMIHLKCIHFDCSSGYIEGDDDRNLYILANECECDLRYRSKTTLWIETILLLFVDVLGGIYLIGSLMDELLKG